MMHRMRAEQSSGFVRSVPPICLRASAQPGERLAPIIQSFSEFLLSMSTRRPPAGRRNTHLPAKTSFVLQLAKAVV